MAIDFEKISDRARIEELIAGQEAVVRRAFRRFLDGVTSAAVLRQVRQALERGSIADAVGVLESHVVNFGTVLARVFQAAGASEALSLARKLGAARSGVSISFDVAYPRAAEIMQRNQLEFVREFSAAQAEATRAALVDALNSGLGPVQAARVFRDSIGLTAFQIQAVANYRRSLEVGDASALERDLRDRRFDPSVRRLLDDGEPLGAKRIDRMVGQYRTRYLQYRAETIARTETLVAVNSARSEALEQVAGRLDLAAGAVGRVWRATRDPRTRDTHAEMDGQERGLREPFVSPSGARLMYPGDRSLGAPASEVINCLLGDSLIEAPALTAIARGWYEGQAISLETASGRKLSVTANHPVMTNVGWCPAAYIEEGDKLVCYRRVDGRSSASTNTQHTPTAVQDLYESSSLVSIIRERLTMNFHGDVIDSEIEIKVPARNLLFVFDVLTTQQSGEFYFNGAHMCAAHVACSNSELLHFHRIFLTAPRAVSLGDLPVSLFVSHVQPLDALSFRLSAWPHAQSFERTLGSRSAHSELLSEIRSREPYLIEMDKVCRIRRFKFSGHVFSPQTSSGLYLSHDILNHNCRCVLMHTVKIS